LTGGLYRVEARNYTGSNRGRRDRARKCSRQLLGGLIEVVERDDVIYRSKTGRDAARFDAHGREATKTLGWLGDRIWPLLWRIRNWLTRGR